MKINLEKDKELIKQKVLLENDKIKNLYLNRYIKDSNGAYKQNITETSLKNGLLMGNID